VAVATADWWLQVAAADWWLQVAALQFYIDGLKLAFCLLITWRNYFWMAYIAGAKGSYKSKSATPEKVLRSYKRWCRTTCES
nr:hypothetical protein [Tanacetum cinerariifolium]